MYVNGYDRAGRAIVIYYPTTDAACPVGESVVFLAYCLDYALALGAAGKGPSGRRIREYSFIIDFSRVGRPAPFKTVKACIAVIGKQ